MAKSQGPAKVEGPSLPPPPVQTGALSGAIPSATFRILATTDLHMHMLAWDYYTDKASHSRGVSLLASLIETARAQVAASVLLDNGDFLQGSPIGDFLAESAQSPTGGIHPMIAAMNHLSFDAVCIGNHEFSHGLDFLTRTMTAATFPVLSANALTAMGATPDKDTFLFAPTTMITRMIALPGQAARPVRIGIVGLTPSQVAQWERDALGGQVFMRTQFEAAAHHLTQLRNQGADLVIALAHSGLGDPSTPLDQENTVILLAKDLKFDAIIAGHTHNMFPSGDFNPSEGFDPVAGLIHGTPVVMPGFYGSHLGVIDLELATTPVGGWQVLGADVALRPVFRRSARGTVRATAPENPAIRAIAKSAHDQTRRWARRKIGFTTQPLQSYFALISPSTSVRLVARAQADYVKTALRGSVWDGLPILSAAAPFRTGGRSGPENYTHVPAGPISLRNIADLYTFPNTVVALILSGAEVCDWLERAAAQFHTIPQGAQDADLINPDMPGFDFDLIDGVRYEIDLSAPPRFDAMGRRLGDDGGRIRALTFDGKPLDRGARFVLASNSYRMGGGGGYGVARPAKQILRGGQSIRALVASYVARNGQIDTSEPANWHFGAMPGTSVVFESSPDAATFVGQLDGPAPEPLARLPSGFQRFRLRL